MTEYGDPRCPYCRGRGRVRGVNGSRVCSCALPEHETVRAIRRAQEAATGRKRLTVAEMVKIGNSDRRAMNG